MDQVAARGRLEVAGSFYQSVESRRTRVAGLYGTLLDRAPESAGLEFWADRILVDGDLALAADLAASDEYHARAWDRFGVVEVESLGAGGGHSCAVITDGSMRCWGDNRAGQLGDGSTTSTAVPVTVSKR